MLAGASLIVRGQAEGSSRCRDASHPCRLPEGLLGPEKQVSLRPACSTQDLPSGDLEEQQSYPGAGAGVEEPLPGCSGASQVCFRFGMQAGMHLAKLPLRALPAEP